MHPAPGEREAGLSATAAHQAGRELERPVPRRRLDEHGVTDRLDDPAVLGSFRLGHGHEALD